MEYDMATASWTELTSKPGHVVAGPVFISSGGKLLMWGGSYKGSPPAPLQLSISRVHWIFGLCAAAGAEARGVAGEDQFYYSTDELWEYDIASLLWTQLLNLGDAPPPHIPQGYTESNGRVYMFSPAGRPLPPISFQTSVLQQ